MARKLWPIPEAQEANKLLHLEDSLEYALHIYEDVRAKVIFVCSSPSLTPCVVCIFPSLRKCREHVQGKHVALTI